MSSASLKKLFTGSNEELSDCVEWLNSTGIQLEILSQELGYYLAEKSSAPVMAKSAMKGVQNRAAICYSRLQTFPDTSCLSGDVTEPLFTAVYAMLFALKQLQDTSTQNSFDNAVDYFLAISVRYQVEIKKAVKGCALTQQSEFSDPHQPATNGLPDECPPRALQKPKRGRKRHYDRLEDEKFETDWNAAKASGSNKSEFCRNRGIEEDMLNLALARVRSRRNRAK